MSPVSIATGMFSLLYNCFTACNTPWSGRQTNLVLVTKEHSLSQDFESGFFARRLYGCHYTFGLQMLWGIYKNVNFKKIILYVHQHVFPMELHKMISMVSLMNTSLKLLYQKFSTCITHNILWSPFENRMHTNFKIINSSATTFLNLGEVPEIQMVFVRECVRWAWHSWRGLGSRGLISASL